MRAKSYAQWASAYFTPAQLADPSISGWTADPDVNEASNGQEYFQGSSPLIGIVQSLFGGLYLSAGGQEIPHLSLRRTLTNLGVEYQLEQSLYLDQWSEVASQVYQRMLTGGNATVDIYIGPIAVPTPSDRIFLRLIFTNTEAQF